MLIHVDNKLTAETAREQLIEFYIVSIAVGWVILYFATSILVCTRIVQLILQFCYAPELFHANNSRTYQNCQNKSSNLSAPELLIQAILGRTRIVRECFTGRLNDADCQVLRHYALGSSRRNEYK